MLSLYSGYHVRRTTMFFLSDQIWWILTALILSSTAIAALVGLACSKVRESALRKMALGFRLKPSHEGDIERAMEAALKERDRAIVSPVSSDRHEETERRHERDR
jgi:hypothetical protein